MAATIRLAFEGSTSKFTTGIAGRSPSYLIRQIYDMQVDSRKGEWTQLMKPVVAKLNEDDLIAIGAYVASIQ